MFKNIYEGTFFFFKVCDGVVVEFTLLFWCLLSAMRLETRRQAGTHQLQKGTAT